MSDIFLTAEWRKLALANYEVDPLILHKYVPPGTELDIWNGTCYVSLVGFMFLNTKLKGIGVPFHKNFEEVNLRFYVRYKDGCEWKRGVSFIGEIVPVPSITLIANAIYKEKYRTMKMRHKWEQDMDTLRVQYEWKYRRWNSISVETSVISQLIPENSEAEFITEHFWGYTKISDIITAEYGVEHPLWRVYDIRKYSVDADFGSLYGEEFGYLKTASPKSVFLAEGSEIVVKSGRNL